MARIPHRPLLWLSLALLLGIAPLAVPTRACGQEGDSAVRVKFLKRVLDPQYYAEGLHFGDINGDSEVDIVCGPHWFPGPSFAQKKAFYEGRAYPNDRGYSNNFFSFVDDIDRDGDADILVVGLPGTPGYWYENPGKDHVENREAWHRHEVFSAIDNESPTYTDLTGDGRKELVCTFAGKLGYLSPAANPTEPWQFHPCSEQGTWHKYTHGLGVGDVNGDNRPDLITARGWWAQPESLEGDPAWTAHHHPFSRRRGGGQMFAYDVDGDGDNDILTSLDAHGWGLVWHEQVAGDGSEVLWRVHRIMDDLGTDNRFGVSFSQLHALDLADVDGDGLLDIVTGKCYWAHNGADPGARDDAVIYAFLLRREADRVWFEPREIDNDSGVGRQVVVTDINGDGHADILAANKKGIFFFEQQKGEWGELTAVWHTANTPVPREQPRWTSRQKLLNERAAEGGEILFLGDSITQGWEGAGKQVWQSRYSARKAINLGIGGDRTQHVLWRLQNGNIPADPPKLAILMIGTNNSRDNTGREIADGIQAIVRELRFQLPQTKILVLGIFPRGANADDPRRIVNQTANELVKSLADEKSVYYLDISNKFLQDDGALSKEIMPDLLHLSPAGYQIWSDAIEPHVNKLLASD